ncbi:hypothetical protein ABT160_18665 [Streptomyces sp. NPDC001941]|uniref:hypothetical protein n=1 Tax=Streptomyces sp. NPDC001941 TaxID=3154659 RepID=UPI00333006B5
MSPHFRFGAHPRYGFVAYASPGVAPHLARWFMSREQFEPVPGTPGLFRLRDPDWDGVRRTRAAVCALRVHRFEVRADPVLDPDVPTGAAGPGNGLLARRAPSAPVPVTLPSLSGFGTESGRVAVED